MNVKMKEFPILVSNRVSASVALVLLETIQEKDQPTEVLKEENTSVTIPRRLGLSQVVVDRIDVYREEVKRDGKIADHELKDLVGLVNKRPDAAEIFFECGQRLALESFSLPRIVKRFFAIWLIKRRISRCLLRLFGRRIGGFSGSDLTFECKSHLFMEIDSAGNACLLLAGICYESARGFGKKSVEVKHTACESQGDAFCRWDIQMSSVTVG